MSRKLDVIDVLEVALEGDLSARRIEGMPETEMHALIRRVAEFYDGRLPEKPKPSEEIVVFSGARDPDGVRRPQFGNDLHVTLLYADRVLLECALGQLCVLVAALLSFRGEAIQKGIDPDAGPEEHTIQIPGYTRSLLAVYVEAYRRYAPLIRGGYLTLMPPVPYLQDHQTEIAQLQLLLWNQIDGWRHEDVEPGAEFWVSKDIIWGLLRAVEWRARFVPTIPAQADFYFHAVRKLTHGINHGDLDTQVMTGIVGAELPLLNDLSVEDVLLIRESEDAFDVWRAELRQATRAIEGLRNLATFRSDARAALDDHLRIAAERVQIAVTRSQALRARASDLTVDAGFSAAAASLGAVAAGVDPAPAALSGIGMGAAMRLAYEAIFQHSPQGDRAVIAYLKQRTDQKVAPS